MKSNSIYNVAMQNTAQQTLNDFVTELVANRIGTWCQWRRHLHTHPELSWNESETTRFIRDRLTESQLRLVPGPRQLGGCVDFDFGRPEHAHRIALRGDMDAIPVLEANEVSYRSQVPGVMHACGHDVHTTVMLAVAETLSRIHSARLFSQPAKMRVIFQPAEEVAQGANESIASGMIDGVDAALAMHVDPSRAVGTIGLRDGVQTACCDELKFVIEGSGGHGARPHETSDTILAAAHLVQTAYSLLPRIIDARDDAVISICRIAGGNSANVIPARLEMLGTLRSFSETPREQILGRLKTLASSTASLFHVNVDFHVVTSIPSVDNCPALNQLVRDVAMQQLGPDAVQTVEPSLGGEDFACYQHYIPGALIRVGSASGNRFGAHLHSPQFDVDEHVIGVACRLFVHSLFAWSIRHNTQNELH